MIDWEALGKVGVSKEMLEQSGALDSMLKGYKTNKTIPLTLNIDGVMTAKLDARLSFISTDGQVILGVHGIRKEPELSRPYFGHNFTEEEKKNLRESGNLGHPVDLNLRGGTYEKCLVSIDRNTNELVAVRQENVLIPNSIKGVTLAPDEIAKLKNGEPVFVDGMTSAKGKEFSATLQYSAERRGIEFIFPKDQGFNQQTLGGVQLSPNQLKMLGEGHTILVEDMKRTNGELFSAFVTLDSVTGKPNYTRSNPETGEIYIPKEISQTPLTPGRPRNAPQRRHGLPRKHGQPAGAGVLLVRAPEHDDGVSAVFPYTGRLQRTAGAQDSGGGLRTRVHRAGEGEPSGRQSHPGFRTERTRRQGVLHLYEGQSEHGGTQLLPGEPGQAPQHPASGGTGRQCPNTAAGTEKGGETGGMTRKKRYSNHEQLKTRKIMEQKTDYVFKEEQIDWNALAKVGIGKEQLAQDGNLDLLLQGRETPTSCPSG